MSSDGLAKGRGFDLRMRRVLGAMDPFILLMLALVVVASIVPVRGEGAAIAGQAAHGFIVLLFFLHGAKLSREAIVTGFGNVRLHLAVLLTSFVVFPLLGLALTNSLAGIVPAALLGGVLFLCLLPSTVQSSIAFTAIAGGNVAAAVCSASLSNMLGIFLTPLLCTLLMQQGADISPAAVERIVLQLLLPFVLGHLCRPVIGGLITRHKALVGRIDRLSILLVVYTAFSASVVEGFWGQMDAAALGKIAAICVVILAVILGWTWWLSGRMGLAREDRIVLLFCGSKKSLASGVPIASTLFPAAVLGPVMLPLMLFHQIQLIACAFIAHAMKSQPRAEAEAGTIAHVPPAQA